MLLYASGKTTTSKQDCYPVVSDKSFWLKRWTRVSQRPLCPCHDPCIRPIYLRGSPWQVFLCPVRAQRYYLKLNIKGQHLNNRFRRLCVCLKLGTQVIYTSRRCRGGSDIWSHKAYSEVQDEDIPHLTHTNLQARELRSLASSLAFHQTIP